MIASSTKNTTPWVTDKNREVFVPLSEDRYKAIYSYEAAFYNKSLHILEISLSLSKSTPSDATIPSSFERKNPHIYTNLPKSSPTPLPLDFEREYSIKLYKQALSNGKTPPFPQNSSFHLGHLITHFQLENEEDITSYETFARLVSEQPIDLDRGRELLKYYQEKTKENCFQQKDPKLFFSYIALHSILSPEDQIYLDSYIEHLSTKTASWGDFFWRSLGYSVPKTT